MTWGVRRSRSLPFSARAGVAKTRTISAMQTLRTHSNESWTCIDMAPRQTVQPSKARNSDRTRKSGKVARHGSRPSEKFWVFFEGIGKFVEIGGLSDCPCLSFHWRRHLLARAIQLGQNGSTGSKGQGRFRRGEKHGDSCALACRGEHGRFGSGAGQT